MHGAVTQEIWKVNSRQAWEEDQNLKCHQTSGKFIFLSPLTFISLERGKKKPENQNWPPKYRKSCRGSPLVQLTKQKKEFSMLRGSVEILIFFFSFPFTRVPALSNFFVVATGAQRNQNSERGWLCFASHGALVPREWVKFPLIFFSLPSCSLPLDAAVKEAYGREG